MRLMLLLTAFLGLFAAFMANILMAPQQLPVIVLTARDYIDPLPPNSWIAEDLAAFTAMDGDTIALETVSFDRNTHQAMNRFQEVLNEAARQHHGAMVIYIAMHATTDATGQPCLLPSSSSPLDSSTWLPLELITDCVDQEPLLADRQIVLVLDTQRAALPSVIAPSYQTFTSRVAQFFSPPQRQRYCVLNAVDEGELGADSMTLGRSIFSYFFQFGLAGMADQYGNRDQSVSLTELSTYMHAQVSEWSRTNRGIGQHPRVINLPPGEQQLTSALNQLSLNHTVRISRKNAPPPSPLKASDLGNMWQRYYELCDQAHLRRLEPERSHRWEKLLLRWQQLAYAGQYYRSEFLQLTERLDMEFSTLERQVRQLEPWQQSLMHSWRAAASVPISIPTPKVRNLVNAVYFGELKANDQLALMQRIGQTLLLTDHEALHAATQKLNDDPLLSDFEELQWVRLMERYRVAERWENPGLLERLAVCQAKARSLGTPWESSGNAPGDERGHAWIRGLIADADMKLRRLEDLVLAGPDNNADTLIGLTDQLQREYVEIETLAAQVSRAYTLRDALLAELPHYVNWYSNHQRPIDGPVACPVVFLRTDEVYRNTWLPLLKAVEELEILLSGADFEDQVPTSAQRQQLTDLVAQLEQQGDDARGSWQVITSAFATYCEELETSPDKAVVVTQLEAILRLPFLPHDRRIALQQRRDSLVEALDSSYLERKSPAAHFKSAPADTVSPVAGSSTDSPGASVAAELYLKWWNNLLLTPQEFMVTFGSSAARETQSGNLADPQTSPATSAAAQVGNISEAERGWLRLEQDSSQLRHWILTRSRDASVANDLANGPSPDEQAIDDQRRRVTRHEALARLAAAQWTGKHLSEAVIHRRRFDLGQLLLWHSEQSLRDFWGPAAPHLPPFFADAARDYLASASSFSAVANESSWITQIDQLQDLSAKLFTLRPEKGSLIADAQNRVDVQVHIERADVSSGIDVARQFIDGLAGCYVFTSASDPQFVPELNLAYRKKEDGTARFFPVFDEFENPAMILYGELSTAASQAYKITVSFRGHEYVVPLSTDQASGIDIVTIPNADPTSSLTVYPATRDFGSVMFLVDSSSSMGKQGADGAPPKISQASEALLELMTAMTQQGTLRAGVTAYGHRIGFGRLTGKVRVQPAYQGVIEDTLRPQQDIETLLHVGPVSEVDLPVWAQTLSSLVGWGQSPHFGAILRAYDEFSVSDAGLAQALVVLTDASQLSLQGKELSEQDDATKQQVIVAMERLPIPIHFLLVGESSADDLAVINELVQRSGGSVRTLGDTSSLIAALAAAAEGVRFAVVNAQGEAIGQAADGTVRDESLGKVLRFAPASNDEMMSNVVVGAASQPIRTRGGEHIELEWSGDVQTLLAPAFRRGMSQTAPLWDGRNQAASDTSLFVHRPERTANQVSFRVSLQAIDRRFVAWPTAAWIEIRPASENGAVAPAYVFYDVPFDPQVPVPMYACVAPHWPSLASRAEVRAWFAYEQPTPFSETSLADFIESETRPSAVAVLRGTLTGPGTTQLSVTSRPRDASSGLLQIDITQRQQPGPEAMVPAGVDLVFRDGSVPIRVTRSYQADLGIVTHSFVLKADSLEDVVHQGAMRVFVREAFQQGGLSLGPHQSVVVPIPDMGNYLP
jgi:hypothetical protein